MKILKVFKLLKQNRGVNHKTATLTTALVIIIAGISYTTLSSNNPIDSAKIASIVNNRDNISQSIIAYIYDVNAKSIKYYSNEEIIKGIEDENISLSGIVDENEIYKLQDKTLYKLDYEKCLNKLQLDLYAMSVSNASWYIDYNANVYLVFSDYDSVLNYIKKNLDNNVTLENIIKY